MNDLPTGKARLPTGKARLRKLKNDFSDNKYPEFRNIFYSLKTI